jgi:hypothetical protein
MLRQCADYLSQMPANDIDALMAGELELRLSVRAKKSKARAKHTTALGRDQLIDIASRLRALDSRADGERLLRAMAPSKGTLGAVARHVDVPIRREDRHEDLLRENS